MMKEFYLLGFILSLYILSDSVGRTDGSNRDAGIQMSVSVANSDENSTESNRTNTASGAHTNIGLWRPRGHIRGQRRPPGHDSNLGPLQPTYVARGRRRPDYIRRRYRQRLNGDRVSRRRHHQIGDRRLVATGSHSISRGSRPQDRTGIDPFVALQRGQRQNGPFQDRRTAYDFLSNGGNSYRSRSRQREERRNENAQMASVMCGVFGKQFIPSAIGGRCVDPA